MKYPLRLLSMNTVFIIAITLLSACSQKNSVSETVNANPEIESTNSMPAPVVSTAGPGGNSNFQFVITESSIKVDPDGTTLSDIGDEYTLETSLSQVSSQYPQVNLAAIGQNSSRNEGESYQGQSASARQLPTSVNYDGGSTIEYVLDGQTKTGSITQDQIDLITDLQQDFVSAKNEYDNIPAPSGGSNPLLQKTDQEIIQMLEAQGYSVTNLGNMRFEITKTMGAIETTEIFDAGDFSFESVQNAYKGNPEYERYFQGGTFKPELNQ